jgi:predicted nucleic acid-binding protein
MRRLYVGSSFYIALTHTGDEHHDDAVRLGIEFGQSDVRFVTSPTVLLEVLAFFSRRGPMLRQRAAALAEQLIASPAVEIVPFDSVLLGGALRLYQGRLDKRYSLVDCVGMVICREREITEVLSTDRDFEAEGFTILLRA